MEYPGSTLKRPLRLAMLITFIAAFFIISPLVIIYSAGYRFDLKNGLLRETGSLSVDIRPESALVYLDGLKIDQKIPIRLNNITPHKYMLKLSLPGYYDWEKQIEINKNQTTYIKELVMLKKERPVLFSKNQAAVLSVSPSGKYLAQIEPRRSGSYLVISDTQTRTASGDGMLLPVAEPIIQWSESGEFLSVSDKKNPPEYLYVISAAQPTKFNKLPGENDLKLKKFYWSRNTEPKLYYEAGGSLFSYLPRLQQSSRICSSTFQDWFMDDGSLWTLNYSSSSKKLSIYSDSLGFKNTFASINKSSSEPSSTLRSLHLESGKKGTVILSDSASEKYFIVRQDRYFKVGGTKMRYSKFGNWLLIWNPWELWTYSEGDDPYLLNRTGENLKNVIPLDEYNTLALVWEDGVTALYPYFYIQRQLISGKVEAVTADPTMRALYYSDESGISRLSY